MSHDSPLNYTAESIENREFSANSKPNLRLFQVVHQGPRCSCFKKNGDEKSRDTVSTEMRRIRYKAVDIIIELENFVRRGNNPLSGHVDY